MLAEARTFEKAAIKQEESILETAQLAHDARSEQALKSA